MSTAPPRTNSPKPRPINGEQARPLNGRQLSFVRHYIANGGNATQAYIDAGYSARGADRSAHNLLRNPRVRAHVDAERKRLTQRARIDGAKLLERMGDVALAEMGDVCSWSHEDGIQLKPDDEIPPGARAAVRRIRHNCAELPNGTRKTQIEIEMVDRTVPQVKLGEYLGLFDGEARGQPAPGVHLDHQTAADLLDRLYGGGMAARDGELMRDPDEPIDVRAVCTGESCKDDPTENRRDDRER